MFKFSSFSRARGNISMRLDKRIEAMSTDCDEGSYADCIIATIISRSLVQMLTLGD